MKILLATGIYPPQIGGPATQAKILFEKLQGDGADVRVINFGNFGHWPKVLRHLAFFWRVWRIADDIDTLYAFDLSSVGLPCAAVKLLKPKIRFTVRLGGDYGWENAAQYQNYDGTLEDYYRHRHFGLTSRLILFVTDFVLKKTDLIVFNSSILRDIYIKYRNVKSEKTTIVRNVAPVIDFPASSVSTGDEIKLIFAGRLVAVKNLPRLIDALALLRQEDWFPKVTLEIVGDGPDKKKIEAHVAKSGVKNQIILTPKLGHRELLEKINQSRVAVLVSLTEIDSNFALEALALRKPVVLTNQSESCYIGDKNALIYYVNPFDSQEIASQIKAAINDHVKI